MNNPWYKTTAETPMMEIPTEYGEWLFKQQVADQYEISRLNALVNDLTEQLNTRDAQLQSARLLAGGDDTDETSG